VVRPEATRSGVNNRMLPSFLTTICFSLSVIFAARSVRLLGGTTANLSRMSVALVVLALWAWTFGKGVAGKSFPWFLLSGVIGFGFGDIALFLALPRIGPRLTILLAQCLAAPFGAIVERVWLGTTLRGAQMACGAAILCGVAIALAPASERHAQRSALWLGSLFGVLAALGQALGAVVTRKANHVAEAGGMSIDGGTAAFQRMLGGIAITALFYLAVKMLDRRDASKTATEFGLAQRWRRGWLWVLLNGLAGPAIGVACYQWALATAPSGIVLPIVATTPIVTMPLSFLIDGDKPPPRSIVGGIIAVAASIVLTRV
jgi:drug/metabolite transporter (DMT)-like permease